MSKTIRLTTFKFLRPAYFEGGKMLVDTVCECCEGMFGVQQFRSACRLYHCSAELGFAFNTDTTEGQAMARVLRHVLTEHLKGTVWAEGTITIDAETAELVRKHTA